MKERIVKNPGESIRARLYNYARDHREDFQRVLTRYAIERLLFRLSKSDAAQRYVLKGAMLFITWPEHAFRPTGDLDLLGQGDSDPATISALFTQICNIDVQEDGIVFDPTTLSVERMRNANQYQCVQLKVRGTLARAIIPIQVDIGFGDYVYPAPTAHEFPSLLPDQVSAPRILMYPPETVIAEKFEAMIRFAEGNGRIKDFHDMWVITRTFPFDLGRLVEAVGGTLRRRKTAIPLEIPVGLTTRFATIVDENGLWTGFLRRTPPALQPPPFAELLEELGRFFGPIVVALATPEGAKGKWDANGGGWQ